MILSAFFYQAHSFLYSLVFYCFLSYIIDFCKIYLYFYVYDSCALICRGYTDLCRKASLVRTIRSICTEPASASGESSLVFTDIMPASFLIRPNDSNDEVKHLKIYYMIFVSIYSIIAQIINLFLTFCFKKMQDSWLKSSKHYWFFPSISYVFHLNSIHDYRYLILFRV